MLSSRPGRLIRVYRRGSLHRTYKNHNHKNHTYCIKPYIYNGSLQFVLENILLFVNRQSLQGNKTTHQFVCKNSLQLVFKDSSPCLKMSLSTSLERLQSRLKSSFISFRKKAFAVPIKNPRRISISSLMDSFFFKILFKSFLDFQMLNFGDSSESYIVA